MNERGARITDPGIEKYIRSLYLPSGGVFAEMEKRAERSDVKIVGPLVGRFLGWICAALKPRGVFEMGSGFGYSALWISLFLPEGGTVTCTDRSEENARLAEDYFTSAGQAEKMRFVVGDALEILENSPGGFDMIFNDVDKEQYPRVFAVAREKLRSGGLLVTDNALWHGKVVDGDGEESTEGVREFNRLVFSDQGFVSALLPLRDGVAVSVKI